MATWEKIKFFYDALMDIAGATLVASSTESSDDYDVNYISNWLEINFWKAANTTTPMYITLDAGGNYDSDIMLNGGFETAGGGGADVWANWTESAGDGAIVNETTDPYAGTNSAKLTEGASDNTAIKQSFSGLTAEDIYELNFYTAGDGTNDGSFRVYDVTNAADIIARTATGIITAPSSSYSLIERLFKLPAGCTQIEVYYYPKAATSGAIAYFDGVTLRKDTQAFDMDYLTILGHNLNTIGATIGLEYSYDNFNDDTNDAYTPDTPGADTVYHKEYTAIDAENRFTRIEITGSLSAAPYMALCVWGLKTELDYARASFDPNAQQRVANRNIGQTGYVLGIYNKYTKRILKLKFPDAEPALYDKINTWWEMHGLKNFFVAWDTANNPDDIFLMRSGKNFNNPFNRTSEYRDISIELEGRKE